MVAYSVVLPVIVNGVAVVLLIPELTLSLYESIVFLWMDGL